MNKLKTYIFHRGDMWYPIELKDDADAIRNAKHNEGTTKVTDKNGRIVWQKLRTVFNPNRNNH